MDNRKIGEALCASSAVIAGTIPMWGQRAGSGDVVVALAFGLALMLFAGGAFYLRRSKNVPRG